MAGAVFFVDRMEEGTAVMRELGVRSEAVVPLDEAAWGIALVGRHVSPGVYASLVKRSKDTRAWAVRALLDNPEYFRNFAAGARDKALKILRTYPEAQAVLKPVTETPGAGGPADQAGGKP